MPDSTAPAAAGHAQPTVSGSTAPVAADIDECRHLLQQGPCVGQW